MDWVEVVRHPRFRAFHRSWLDFLRRYFRVEVKGLEHVPEKGPVLVIANHSGFAGSDAVLLADVLFREKKRHPRILAHRAFFDFSNQLRKLAEAFGLKKAGIELGAKVLSSGKLILLFPEGEKGNFKPSLRRYRLQRFHTGFLRMALLSKATVVPCVIIGAEESHLNLGTIDLGRFVRGLSIPVPLTLVPLPAKWTIRFLPPLDPREIELVFPEDPPSLEEILNSPERLRELAWAVQRRMQGALDHEIATRPYIYSRRVNEWLGRLTRRPKRAASRKKSGSRKGAPRKTTRKKAGRKKTP